MIDLENLNNQSFDDIVESAKKQILQLSYEWNNTQESDPGITLIELFSWLKVVQHEYINKVKDESKNKFLQLLDIEKKPNEGARTHICISNVLEDIIIPKKTKWYVEDVNFENENAQQIICSNIVSVEFGSENEFSHTRYDNFDGKRIFNVFGNTSETNKKSKQAIFKLNFDKEIGINKKFNIYFDTFLESKYTRNPIKPNDEFIDMAKIIWEFYGEENGIVGWHRIRVISDNTYKFLFSGIIEFQLEGKMEALKGLYTIRAKLIDQNYDFPPRITNIKTNVFEVTQKSTMCENTIIKNKMISNDGTFSISSNLSIYGKNLIYIKNGDGWERIEKFAVKQKINENKSEFHLKNIKKYINHLTPEDDAIMVISYDKDIESQIILGNGTGASGQKIELNLKNIYYDDFELMVGYNKDDINIFDKWVKVNDFYPSEKYDKHYILDYEKDNILFGDHEMGQAPRKGENNIVLCSLSYTKGKDSNIRSGMIKNVRSENPIISAFKIEQITAAKGGRNSDQFDDIKNKAAEALNSDQKAVISEDYEKLARRSPGLVIENIKVLASDKNEVNDVNIIVRNGNQSNKKPNSLKSYEDNIKKYMNDYRLINTKITVSAPVYIGLQISGQIIVNAYYKQSADEISDEIKKFVKKLNEHCGQTLYYGDLFGAIDKLSCVSYVDSLYITPNGDNVSRNIADDVIVPANAVYYIDDLNLNYIKSANI